MFFYNDDTKLLLLNNNLDKKAYTLDLERGSITNEIVSNYIINYYFNIFQIRFSMIMVKLVISVMYIRMENVPQIQIQHSMGSIKKVYLDLIQIRNRRQ